VAVRSDRWHDQLDTDDDGDGEVVAVMYEIGSRHGSTSDARTRAVTQAELHPPGGAIPEQRARAAYRDRIARTNRDRGRR
jgi:hypothetical protein